MEGYTLTVHWVNYDLNRTGQDYDSLIAYLKSHLSWAKPAKSSFFVKTNLSAGQLRDGIKAHLDGNDAVTVVAVDSQNWATMGVSKEVSDWMRANI